MQLLVYCIVTSINSMMNSPFMRPAQLFLNAVRPFFRLSVRVLHFAAECIADAYDARCIWSQTPFGSIFFETLGWLSALVFPSLAVCCFAGSYWRFVGFIFLFGFSSGCILTLVINGRMIYNEGERNRVNSPIVQPPVKIDIEGWL